MQSQYTYELFGKTTATGVASTKASTYTGQEDDGTGLYYCRARYYDPALQRFISENPIGFEGDDQNLYAYVTNDPLNYVDPEGWGRGVRRMTSTAISLENFRARFNCAFKIGSGSLCMLPSDHPVRKLRT